VIHENPLRGKQDETKRVNSENLEIIVAELAKLNQRYEDAKRAKDWRALRRVAIDYIAISKRQVIEINNALPAKHRIPLDELRKFMDL
jgi:hypothetical protein